MIDTQLDGPKTYLSIESIIEAINNNEINFPVIIKPRWGIGSIAVFEANNINELQVLYNKAISDVKNSYSIYEYQVYLKECIIIKKKYSVQLFRILLRFNRN